MLSFLGAAGEGHAFFILAVVAAALLMVFMKDERRWRFVLPALLMGLVIANPWFRSLWEDKLQLKYYWRILWIVPVIPLCAALPAMLAEKIKRPEMKALPALLCAGVFAVTGTFVYNQANCGFTVTPDNWAKLPQDVVDVAEALLAQEENPRVVADREVAIYLRQYTGKIETLYGRDIDGYIIKTNQEAQDVASAISDVEGDLDYVASVMLDKGYDYLVIDDSDVYRREQLADSGFTWVTSAGGWGIYRVDEVEE